MCKKTCCQSESSGSFVTGMIFGLIVAAIVVVIIYKKNRQDIFKKITDQLFSFFSKNQPSKNQKISKKAVIIPKKVISRLSLSPTEPAPKPRLFKSKR